MGKTVVVGGGTAGLAAGYVLDRAGADYLVLEKNKYSGGRIYGVVHDGFTLDLGAQFFFTRYHATFEMMRMLGIENQLVKFMKPLGILRDGTVHVANPRLRYNLARPFKLATFGAISNVGKRRLPRLGLKLFSLWKKLDFDDPLKAIELDNISVAEYVQRNLGSEILEYIVQPVISALTLGEPENVSAAYGLGLIWYAVAGLLTLKKGIGFLADSMTNNISNLELETEVNRVVFEKKKVKGVEVGSGKGKDFIDADNVICATTASAARKLLSGISRKLTGILGQVNYSSTVHVMFALPYKPVGDIYGIATPRREGLSMPGFVENVNKWEGYAPPNCGLIHTFTYGDYSREMMGWDDGRIQDKMTQELQMVVPQFPDDPIFCEIFRWPEAVCLSSPGQISSVQRLKVGIRDYEGIELAGEYLALPSVEGAIDSGMKAANRVLKRQ